VRSDSEAIGTEPHWVERAILGLRAAPVQQYAAVWFAGIPGLAIWYFVAFSLSAAVWWGEAPLTDSGFVLVPLVLVGIPMLAHGLVGLGLWWHVVRRLTRDDAPAWWLALVVPWLVVLVVAIATYAMTALFGLFGAACAWGDQSNCL